MSQMEKVTLTLPKKLMKTVRQMAPARGQSKFIAQAVEMFIQERQREALRAELIAGYQATAAESLAVTQEWKPLDEEAWSQHVPPYEGEEPAHDAADSTQ